MNLQRISNIRFLMVWKALKVHTDWKRKFRLRIYGHWSIVIFIVFVNKINFDQIKYNLAQMF